MYNAQQLKKIGLWSLPALLFLTILLITPLGGNLLKLLQSNLLSQSSYERDSGLYLGKTTTTASGTTFITLGTGAILTTDQRLNESGALIVDLTVGSETGYNSLTGLIAYNPNEVHLDDSDILPLPGIESDMGITKVLKDGNNNETGQIRFSFDKQNNAFTLPRERIAQLRLFPKGNNLHITLEELRLMVSPPLANTYGVYLKRNQSTEQNLMSDPLSITPISNTQWNKKQILTGSGGEIIVTIPDGAMTDTTQVTLTKIPKETITIGNQAEPITNGYDLSGVDTTTNQPLTEFKKPITIEFFFNPNTFVPPTGYSVSDILPFINTNGTWFPVPASDIILKEPGHIIITSRLPGKYVIGARYTPIASKEKLDTFNGMPTPTAFTPAVSNVPSKPSAPAQSSTGTNGGNASGSSSGTTSGNPTGGATTNTPTAQSSPSGAITTIPTTSSGGATYSCLPSQVFTDTRAHWGYSVIERARLLCIISGKRPGIFAPNDYVSRAELTKIALYAFGQRTVNEVLTKPFSDIDMKAWYGEIIATAKVLKIINGYADGTFKPNNYINRAEAVKIIIGAAGVDIKAFPVTGRFIDTSFTAWYAPYISYAKAHSIISGYIINNVAYFKPTQNITRAEAVKIIMGLYDTSSQK